MKHLLYFLIGLTATIILGSVLQIGLDRQETADCLKWQQWEQQYPLYETSPETAKECQARGVNVYQFID